MEKQFASTTDRVARQPSASLRTRLLTLAAVPLVPAVVLVALLVVLQALRQREEAEASALRTAHALAVAIDARLREAEAGLAVLAVSDALQDEDFDAFQAQALLFQKATTGVAVFLTDKNGRQIVNTFAAADDKQAPPLSPEALAVRVIATGKPMAQSAPAASADRPIAIVTVPVRIDEQVRYALSTTIGFRRFDELLQRQRLPPSWIGVVLDPTRTVVARTSESNRFVGNPASKTLVEALTVSPEGAFDGMGLDGAPLRTLYASAGSSGWSVAIGVPQAELTRELRVPLLWLSLASVLVFGLAFTGAWWYSGRIGRAVDKLMDATTRLGRGEMVEIKPLGIPEADQLADAMVRASGELHGARDVLARNEARWSAVLESAMDGIVAVNEAQRIVIYNPAAERIFGWSRHEAMGQPLEMLIPPMHRSAHAALLLEFGRTRQTSRRMGGSSVVSGLRKGGEIFPIEASISHLDTGSGELYTVIVRDVTEAVRTRNKLSRLAADAILVREQEKARIARELHDDLAQSLTVLKMDIMRLKSELGASDPGVQQKLRGMIAEVDRSVAATRRIATDLRPLLLDDLGLEAAINWLGEEFSQRTGTLCTVRQVGEMDLPEPYATSVFRILQEALANVAKHAQARHVEVIAERDGPSLLLVVQDDGVGFDAEMPRKPSSLGLAGLRERVHLLQGKLAVISQIGSGTRIEVRILM